MAAATVKFTTIGSDVDLTSTTTNPGAAPTSTPRQGGFTLRNRFNASDLTAANKLMWVIDDASLSDDAVKNMRVLAVPNRTYIRQVFAYAIASQTVPNFHFVAAKTAKQGSIGTASDLDAMTVSWGADQNKKPTSHASYAAASHLVHITVVNGEVHAPDGEVAGDVFGNWKGKCIASDSTWSSNGNWVLLDKFQKVDSSIGNPTEIMAASKPIRLTGAAATGASTLAQMTDGHYFPYGGFVTMRLGPYNTSLSSSVSSGKIAGYFSSPSVATPNLDGVWEVQAEAFYVPE